MKAKNIPGFMIEEIEILKGELLTPNYEYGFNEAREMQGEREITLNRDRLASLLYEWLPYGHLRLADAIISAEAEIIEVKK